MEKHEKTAETKSNEKMKRSKSESSLETKNCVELNFNGKKNNSRRLIEEDERNRQERKLEELNEGTFKYYINS